MSHFTVAVFTEPNGKTIDELLAPYQENNMNDCPKEYLAFNDEEDNYRKQYETEEIEMVKTWDGRLLYTWDEEFRKEGTIGLGSDTHEVPNNEEKYKKIMIKQSDKYSTFEEFMSDFCGYKSRDEKRKDMVIGKIQMLNGIGIP